MSKVIRALGYEFNVSDEQARQWDSAMDVSPKIVLTEQKLAHLTQINAELVQALQLLHDDIADYARINNIGGYDNHCMKLARAALAKAKHA